jgi:hypothetical protein
LAGEALVFVEGLCEGGEGGGHVANVGGRGLRFGVEGCEL